MKQESLDEGGLRVEKLALGIVPQWSPLASVALGRDPSRRYLTIGGIPISVIVEGTAYCGS